MARYIGLDPTARTVVQIDGNKSAYVNVKSFGAAGLDQYFTGGVSGASSSGSSIFINSISNYSQFEEDFFTVGKQITAFFLTEDTAPDVSEYGGIFSSPNISAVGSIRDENLASARTIEYYLFPYNVQTGRFSPYSLVTSLTGIVVGDPRTEFDEDNYVQVTFNRSSSDWIPVIYRRYGGRVDFISAVGNGALQTSTQVTFFDRGSTQTPSWDEATIAEDPNFLLPDFLDGQILLGSSGGPVGKAVIGKRVLQIVAKNDVTKVVEFADALDPTSDLSSYTGSGVTVKFKFDDTAAIQRTIDYAKDNAVKNVFFPTGTYNVGHVRIYGTSDPSAYSGISLFGTGNSSIIKKSPSFVNGVTDFGTIGVLGTGVTGRIDGITIKDLAFDGNKPESISVRSPQSDVYGISSKYQDFIALEFADSITIQNCSQNWRRWG